MSKESKKTKFYDCGCGRKVPLDGVKVMRHRIPGSSEYCEQGDKAVLTPAQEADKAKLADKTAAGMVQIKCLYPPCEERVLVKAPPPGVTVGSPQHMASLGGIPMCTKHGELMAFMVWFTLNIKLQPQQTASGLVLPGNEQYQAIARQGPAAQSREQEKSFVLSQRKAL